MNKKYGYVRVSTKEQNIDRQLIAIRELSIPENHIFIDYMSGKDFQRPSYIKMLSKMKPGDMLIIKSIDRLGRNYHEIKDQWRLITQEMQVDVAVLDMPLLDTAKSRDLLGTFISDIVLQLLSFVAENERESIRQRQAEGIAAAKARGYQFGRPVIPLPDNFQELYNQWQQKQISIYELANKCNMKRSTMYKKIKEYRGEN